MSYPLVDFLPVNYVCNTYEDDDPPNSLCHISLLRTREQTSSNFIYVLLDELLTVVTLALQLYGWEDKSINARTTSSNLIPTELNWDVTILNSLICCEIDAPSVNRNIRNYLIK